MPAADKPKVKPQSVSLFALLIRQAGLACWLWVAIGILSTVGAKPLVLDERQVVPAWPAVTLLADPTGQATAEQLLLQPSRFSEPSGTANNLGRRDEIVWLRIPVLIPGPGPVDRILRIDYPPLNSIELYVVRDGVVVRRALMGNELRMSERPLRSRSHAVPLTLESGRYELLMRVETLSSMVLPISVLTNQAFVEQESSAQIVQGIILGLALCMLLYSLMHWLNLRDSAFIQYAFLLSGNVVFTLSYFGIGAQYLWPDWPELSVRIAPMAVMVAVIAGATFVHTTLAVNEISRLTSIVLRLTGAAAVLGLLAMLSGLIGYRVAQSLVIVLGLLVTLGVLPVAFVRACRGERVAMVMLFGWTFYLVGALTTSALLRGYIEPSFWAQYLYPFSIMIEMTAWMGVLGLRVQSIHRKAVSARVDADTQRMLAHTDALTGLPNRRGLRERLAVELQRCSSDQVLALYLLDLDGFKPINDRWGHDVGDALLVAVGQRLKAQLRSADVVVRLGGDEFVVLAGDLRDEAAAEVLGQKLLYATEEPLDAAGQQCKVGLTVGYALAPFDSHTADGLIKHADAAMYAGKARGRGCLQRGGRASASADNRPGTDNDRVHRPESLHSRL